MIDYEAPKLMWTREPPCDTDINSYCTWQARSKIDIMNLVFLQLAKAKDIAGVKAKTQNTDIQKSQIMTVDEHALSISTLIQTERQSNMAFLKNQY